MYSFDFDDVHQDLFNAHKDKLLKGYDQFVTIPGGKFEDDYTIYIPDPSQIEVVEPPTLNTRRQLEHRKLARKFGKKTALVIRVESYDGAPKYSNSELFRLTFENDVSLQEQLKKCSFGSFQINPTAFGVLDVFIDKNSTGRSPGAVTNDSQKAALERVNMLNARAGEEVFDDIRDVADFILYVLPRGTTENNERNWLASAPVYGVQSMYNDRWGGRVSTVIHEIGHNLGMDHANQGGEEYRDSTGYMGRSLAQENYPARCFNAYHHWFLGWHRAHSTAVNPITEAGKYKIIPFVDFEQAQDDEFTIIRVGSVYMQYNRKTKFNRDTGEKEDQLVIVRGPTDLGTDLLAGLDGENPTLLIRPEEADITIDNDNENEVWLVIDVCRVLEENESRLNTLVVSISLGESACSRSIDAPTSAPFTSERKPTTLPTRLPQPAPEPTMSPNVQRPISETMPPSGPWKVDPYDGESDDVVENNTDSKTPHVSPNDGHQTFDLSPIQLAGMVIGSLAILSILAVLIAVCRYKKKKKKFDDSWGGGRYTPNMAKVPKEQRGAVSGKPFDRDLDITRSTTDDLQKGASNATDWYSDFWSWIYPGASNPEEIKSQQQVQTSEGLGQSPGWFSFSPDLWGNSSNERSHAATGIQGNSRCVSPTLGPQSHEVREREATPPILRLPPLLERRVRGRGDDRMVSSVIVVTGSDTTFRGDIPSTVDL